MTAEELKYIRTRLLASSHHYSIKLYGAAAAAAAAAAFVNVAADSDYVPPAADAVAQTAAAAPADTNATTTLLQLLRAITVATDPFGRVRGLGFRRRRCGPYDATTICNKCRGAAV